MPRRRAAVDREPRARRDHVDLLRGEDARRRERHAEHRLDDDRQDRVALAQRVEHGRRIAVEGKAELGQQRARRLGDVVGRLALAHRLQEGDHLQQRVVAHLRRRGVARDALGAHREAKDALLGHAHAVDALVAEGEDGARALVEQHVAAHGVGVVLGQPDRALAAAGLLVDHADHEQVAARRAPARLRERQGGRHLGRRLGLHVLGAATPEHPVDDVARPRVALPLGGVGEHRVDVARAGTASARRRRRAARATRFGRSSVRPSSCTSKPASRSMPASSSWAARSSPGGLTVLKRTRRWSSSVVSRSRSSAIAPQATRRPRWPWRSPPPGARRRWPARAGPPTDAR